MSQEITKLLESGESDILEYKARFQRSVVESVVAFANTRGGTILIGINDQGKPIGVTLGKESLKEWANEISANTEPTVIPEIRSFDFAGKTIVVIQIPEFPIKPISTSGRCYRRISNSNRRLTPKEIAELHLAGTGSSWDALPARGKTSADIDVEKVRKYMALSSAIGRRKFTSDLEPLDVLRKLELIVDDRPTWAAILLFGKNPQSPLVQAKVHCGRFREEIHIMDDRLIEGSIIDQVDEALDFVKKHINVRFIIKGKPRREEIWDYPLDALREGIVNAICHRDYSDNADIQIKVFDERIQIWSPGFLPFNLTVEELYSPFHSSKPRNKLIAQIFYDLALIERYGSGIQRMITACQKAGLPDLEFNNFSSGFILKFFKLVPETMKASDRIRDQKSDWVTDPVTAPVSEQILKILFALEKEPLSSQELRTRLGLKHRAFFRANYLKPAFAAGFIERTLPEKPNSRFQKYRLTEKGRRLLEN